MADDTKCDVCGERLVFQWSDTHGVGVCCHCLAPYNIYQYENDKRVDGPPTLALTEQGKALALRYWQETNRKVFPGTYDMGIGRNGCTYSGATGEDIRHFNAWYARQPEAAQAEAA